VVFEEKFMKGSKMNNFKQPKVIIALAVLLIAVVAIWNVLDFETDKVKTGDRTKQNKDKEFTLQSTDVLVNDADQENAMPRHQDMLTEEMKQGIRDQLLFHGPMETIENADGSVELQSNGRFTQMPVAVKMPDGTIQIKEYSKLPSTSKLPPATSQ
jgi:hypothetical protein|tara:strand:- start:1272 stop:1739 length:468 start_codon:yes stop_codon:yes gene_type:complete